ncbi:xanthine dehydrogenase family protein molybdopterin-binding subunit [Rhodovarius crocodyli]|uniref:Xanthine dehydrogenase family protein molybdopterin-binding subunit n=1 Tax=Rhodovarius crocodyli TaxID=1979269 RepID=A0A437LZB0_9PROT|nr:xanthine dehydrogenase family protein molybdopterin-binding subunit [Rhodovarius crocodyli]RVT90653.1 xanthine dehydrogenase family protein molybdopterin-binding subunit [Rhodovarius crocodyli]
MPDALEKSWIGAARRRVEDDRLLRGQGRFVADVPQPAGTLHAVFLRAAQAPGLLAPLDTAPALAVPGVVAVLTADELSARAAPAINEFADVKRGPLPRFAMLAGPEVLAPGEALALILAETRPAAEDGAEALSAVIEPQEAGLPVPAFTGQWQRAGDAVGAPIRASVEYARVATGALEPRAALAVPETGGLTVWLSTQTPHRARRDLAAVLGLDPAELRVIAPDVGGAFGGKASLFPEEAAVAMAALRLGRPVRWVATRAEEFLAACHGRGGRLSGSISLDAEGQARRVTADVAYPLGWRLPYSAAVPGRNAARGLPGPYDIRGIKVAMAATPEARPAMGIHRGAGRPEASMLMERLMDRAARQLGLSPLEIRRRNLVRHFPHTMPGGEALDSGDLAGLLDAALRHAGGSWHALEAERDAMRARGLHAGLGLALYAEPCGQGYETATLTVQQDGSIQLATGSTAQGQGRETAFAQIAADILGVEPGMVRVLEGDTATTPEGIGALASRSTGIGGGAVIEACFDLLAQAGNRALRDCPGLSAHARYVAAMESWASGAVIALVTLCGETGATRVERLIWVDDAGVVLNPMLARGQMWGGLMMGLGETLLEAIAFDAHGQLLTGSFMDYAMPRADDLPARTVLAHADAPSPAGNTPLGSKGVGEAGNVGVSAALVNAIMDAAFPAGDQPEHVPLPLTPERVWRLLQKGN